MAKKISYKSGGVLGLNLSEKFIAKYKFERIINDPVYFSILLSPELSNSICFPLRLGDVNAQFYHKADELLSLLRSLLKRYQIDEIYEDYLIFFSKVLFHIRNEKKSQILKDDHLRSNGKLLVELIEVPFTKYSIDNFHEQFDSELSDAELDDLLFMYLGIVSGMPEESFRNDVGKLALDKVSQSIAFSLMERLTADKNISVKLEDPILPDGFKYLIISNDVFIKFNSKKKQTRRSILPLHHFQNKELMQMIVNQLVNEQKKEGTELYTAILGHNFFGNSSELGKSVGKWHHSNHLGYNLNKLYTILITYIDDEAIFSGQSAASINRRRSDFILQYFTLMGWTNHKGNFLESTNILSIKAELTKLSQVSDFNISYSSKILSDIFKPTRSTIVNDIANS